MNIYAEIRGIQYKIVHPKDLQKVQFSDFDINTMPSSCLVQSERHNFAISKWVSPKRTRSYPFERVYNTLSTDKKFTVIPIIKDEGLEGDRDYIQWDTVSLMSLLDVYVIFAYYHKAEKHNTKKNKITNQQFDNSYIIAKINEISNYHSSALHWNIQEIEKCLPNLIKKVKTYYAEIGKEFNVKFHSADGIDKFQEQFTNGVEEFMKTSRYKAKDAQNREKLTIQPKEILTTATKATITIKNFLGGLYYLTTDEVLVQNETLYLIENKHSKSAILPSLGDIKDGLFKMILYCNLSNVVVKHKPFNIVPILKLTSSNLSGCLKSNCTREQKEKFFNNNNLSLKLSLLIDYLIIESQKNSFEIIIQGIQNE